MKTNCLHWSGLTIDYLNLYLNKWKCCQTASQPNVVSPPLFTTHVRGPSWKLFLLLREICSVIFAPVVTNGLGVFLKQSIIDHHDMFKTLYPDRPLIPKQHFMTQYGRTIVMFGLSLSSYGVKLWCIYFESKRCPLKLQAPVVCNFKNISFQNVRRKRYWCWMSELYQMNVLMIITTLMWWTKMYLKWLKA